MATTAHEMAPTWNVWLVTDVYPPDCGGSGWSAHALARTLTDRGHRVEVILVDPAGSDVTTRSYEGIGVTAVGVRAARTPRRRLGARDYAHSTLANYLHERLRTEPDVDVVHGQHLHSTPPAVEVGRRHGRATLATVRDYWPVCLHGTSWWAGRICSGCSTENLTGCMAEYWSWPRPVGRIMVGWARSRLAARAAGLAAADKVLTVSEAVRHRIAHHLPNADLAVVPNIVDPEQVAASAAPSSGRGEPYYLAAGKLQPTKGFHLLFEMLGQLDRRVRLIVAGDGPARGDLEAQAAADGLDATFTGWVDHERLLGLQRDAHAVILPSAWDEPLSRLVLETMGLGTPVIAWARGGNPEIIDSGKNGWLVRSADDLTAALDDLQSADRRASVGVAARDHLTQCYAPDAVYPAVAAAYADAIEKSGRRPGRAY